MAPKPVFRTLSFALFLGLSLCAGLLWGMRELATVYAAGPIVVNTTADEDNTDGDCSLREAIKAANIDAAVDACAGGSGADVITFSLGVDPTMITLTEGELVINKALTIDGPGATLLTINGNRSSRIFNVERVVPVTLTGMTLRNGRSINNGGAVIGDGDLILMGLVLENNVAFGDGGAIDLSGLLRLRNTRIISNTARGDGGAINNLSNRVEIEGGVLTANRAGGAGGAINAGATAVLSGTELSFNRATNFGGALFAYNSIDLANTQIISNTAARFGGVFALGDSRVLNTDFISNTAVVDYGALWVNNGDLHLQGSRFISNTAGQAYGSLRVSGNLWMTATRFVSNTAGTDYGALRVDVDAVIRTSAFTSNVAGGDWGAVRIADDAVISGTDFVANIAAGSWGAMQINGNAEIQRGQFLRNRALGGDAGALQVDGVLTVTGTALNQNRAQARGGALLTEGPMTTLVGTNLFENKSDTDGGGLHVQHNLVLTGALLGANIAGGSGGGMIVYGDEVTIDASRFIANYARIGGAAYLTGSLAVNNSEFSQNYAENFAGAVYVLGDALLTATTFVSNTVFDYSVGALYVEGDLRANDVDFSKNKAKQRDGATFVGGNATLVDSSFSQNRAQGGQAGALDVLGSLVLTDTDFTQNTAAGNSGAIHVNGDLQIHGGAILTNMAGDQAGAINALGAQVQLEDVTISDNEAAEVGALYVAGDLRLRNTTVLRNEADIGPGAIRADNDVRIYGGELSHNVARGDAAGALAVDGSLWLTGTVLADNRADADGGAVDVAGSLLAVNAEFRQNQAGRNGGAADVGAALTLQATTVISNEAVSLGGGFNVAGATAGITGGRFGGNEAGQGGAMYVRGALTLSGTAVISNAAQGAGGFFVARTAIITAASFEENRARNFNVGALYVEETLHLTDSTFWGNEAYQQDGAVWVGGNAYLGYSHFEGNRATTSRAGALAVGGSLWLTETHFTANHAGGDSGALHVAGSLTLRQSDLLSNTAGGQGGAASSLGTQVTVEGGRFSHNRAETAGVLYVAGRLQLSGTKVISNTATRGRGAVYVGGNAELSDSLFERNQAADGAAGALDVGGSLWLTRGTFITNTAAGDGGAMQVGGALTVTSSEFRANRSAGDGGAVAVQGDLTMWHSDLQYNRAGGQGGGLYGLGAANEVAGGVITANIAHDTGGGLYLDGGLVLSGTSVVSNSARNFSGGVLVQQSAMLTNTHFERNRAANYSVGGLYVGHDLSLRQTGFLSNTAGQRDGALWVGNNATVVDASFVGNQARTGQGGALRVGGSLWLTRGTFIANSAGGNGGALVLDGQGGRVVNTLFARNYAVGRGSALVLQPDGTFALLHTTIAGAAGAKGSAIFVNAAGQVSLTNTLVAGYEYALVQVDGQVFEDYNFFDQTMPLSGTITSGGHSQIGDAHFVDPAADDYHLDIGSWALNRGVDIGLSSDFEGDARPGGGGMDIGFDETTYTSAAMLDMQVFGRPALYAPLTYTLSYSNIGQTVLFGLELSDTLPNILTQTRVVTNADILSQSRTTDGYRWQLRDLRPGEGGTLTMTGILTYPLPWGVFTNTAWLGTTSPDLDWADNRAVVTATVVNAAPVAGNDVYTTTEDIALRALLPLANDHDDNLLRVAAFTQPSHGLVEAGPGNTLIYTPTANFHGVDSFSYTVGDTLLTDTAIISIVVTPVNDAPLLAAAERLTVTMSEDSFPVPFNLQLNVTDVDGDSLVWSLPQVTGHGPIQLVATSDLSAALVYTPATHYNGLDQFVVQVSDGLLSDMVTIDVVVMPIDDAPLIAEGQLITVTMSEDGNPQPFDLSLTGVALDAEDFMWQIEEAPLSGQAAISATFDLYQTSAVISYTPPLNFNGQDRFVVRVSDGHSQDRTTVRVMVESVNDAPLLLADSVVAVQIDEDNFPTPFSLTLQAEDVDDDPLIWRIVRPAAHGQADVPSPDATDFGSMHVGRSIVYTPNLNYVGADSFTIEVSDGLLTSSVDISVSVRAVNDAPRITAGEAITVTFSEDDTPVPFKLHLQAIDPDARVLRWTIIERPVVGTAAISDTAGTYVDVAEFDYAPPPDYFGPDAFRVQVIDGVLTDEIRVNVVVTPVNDAPVVNGEAAVVLRKPGGRLRTLAPLPLGGLVASGEAVWLDVLANDTDVENSRLTISRLGQPPRGKATITLDSKLSYLPEPDFTGLAVISYTVSDGELTSAAHVSPTVVNGHGGGIAGESFTVLGNGLSGPVTITVQIPEAVIDHGDFALVYNPLSSDALAPSGYGGAELLFRLSPFCDGRVWAAEGGYQRPLTLTIDYANLGRLDEVRNENTLHLMTRSGTGWSTGGVSVQGRDVVNKRLVVNVAAGSEFGLFRPVNQIHLPLMFRNHWRAPDLQIRQLRATPDQLTVTIINAGTSPVFDAFWVDVYINPTVPPTQVNQIWQTQGGSGAVWGVLGDALPMRVGEVLTLTLNDAYFVAEESNYNMPLEIGTPIYAQVDSAARDSTVGGVIELHELTKQTYNNIVGPVPVTASESRFDPFGSRVTVLWSTELLPQRGP